MPTEIGAHFTFEYRFLNRVIDCQTGRLMYCYAVETRFADLAMVCIRLNEPTLHFRSLEIPNMYVSCPDQSGHSEAVSEATLRDGVGRLTPSEYRTLLEASARKKSDTAKHHAGRMIYNLEYEGLYLNEEDRELGHVFRVAIGTEKVSVFAGRERTQKDAITYVNVQGVIHGMRRLTGFKATLDSDFCMSRVADELGSYKTTSAICAFLSEDGQEVRPYPLPWVVLRMI